MKRKTRKAPPARLARYNEKRDFGVTKEPSGDIHASESGRSFVVQKHDARRLHYDFRLELDGVLLSWAVPKGPSLSPKDRRLAVQTEDHPVDYRDFEGTIPEGEYGGGPVIVWDRGTWTAIGDPHEGMKRGRLDFTLDGEKLHGRFILVRTKKDEKGKASWLLMKRADEYVEDGPIVDERPESVLTGLTIEEVASGKASSARGKQKRLPAFGKTQPQLATLVDDVPRGTWLYEPKYDGYRALTMLTDGAVRIASRNGKDWTDRFREIAGEIAHVRAKTALFDGEIAYVLPDGRTDFQMLQNTLGKGSASDRSRLVYFIFDLLHYDGVDLTGEPLARRKDLLRTILAGEGPPLRLGDHVTGDGEAFFREACKLGLEGIVAKRADRPYVEGRGKDWVKVKCQQRQELVIVGMTPPKGGRKGIGALLLAVREGKNYRYAGKVGTGFTQASLLDLAKRLAPLVVDEPPVVGAPKMRDATWVRPELVCQVRFTEWTRDGALRHPAFEGLREDKKPAQVTHEKPQATPAPKRTARAAKSSSASKSTSKSAATPRTGARAKTQSASEVAFGIKVSHPDRIVDEDTGLTKLDVVRYHALVAPLMIPFAKKRPLMLRRATETGSTFIQKHASRGLQQAKYVIGDALGDEEILYVEEAGGIVELAQYNAAEIHGWGSRMPKPDRPDWIIFDLDPDESLPFARVVEAAIEVRDALSSIDLESFVKTTGGKGLHVVVPIAARYGWDVVRPFAERIARAIVAQAPDRYVANMSKKVRVGKIFIDYLRNAEGATAILPYSPRARAGLPVAMPIAWRDLAAIDPRELTVLEAEKYLAKRRRDPWADLVSMKQLLRKDVLGDL